MISEKQVCTEVCLYLNTINRKQFFNIPSEIVQKIYEISEVPMSYEKYSFDDYKFSDRAKEIIAYIYYEYILNENDKKNVEEIIQKNDKILELEAQEKFKNINLFDNFEKVDSNTTSLIIKKENNIFGKIINFIKKTLKIK